MKRLIPTVRPPAVQLMERLGLAPDRWQREVLEAGHPRLLLNCCRQAGKTTVVGLLGLSEALYVPHTKVLRPPIKQKCRDSFCPIGAQVSADQVRDPGALEIRAFVNGQLKATRSLRDLIRPVPRLLAEVTEFMTLEAGDSLVVGVPEDMPLARAGDCVPVEIEGVGRLENTVRAEGASA